ncbi:MAG: ABC transporter transmembrane domain-containing protein, partial [Pseudomonadales bacterium]
LVFTSALALSLGQGIKLLIDSGFGENSGALLNRAVVILLLLTVLFATGTFVRFYLVSWLGERVSADIRRDVFDHIVYLHPGFFETNRSGEIASRITTDTTLLQTIIGSSISMALRSALTATGGLVMLFITNAKLMLIVVAAVPLVLLPLAILGKRVKSLSRESQDSVADVGSYAGEIIQHIKTVQSFTRERQERRAFAAQVERAFDVARGRIRVRALMLSIVMLLVLAVLSMMLWVGGHDVIAGTMTPGDLAAFVFYAMLVATGAATISEVWSELLRAAGATERLVELLAEQSAITAPPQATASGAESAHALGAQAASATHSDRQAEKCAPALVSFERVSFSYPSRSTQAALDDISLQVADGECVALVGPSGAGKSTLFELLQRFYDPQRGCVCFDGRDIRSLEPAALRSQIAVVAQQPALFTGDVASNIRYGKPDASDAEVAAAARAANAHQFIEQLPEGYRSFLGEQGVRLSGGQRQRIAIARAILKNPRVLLLDEATSALDSESEHLVQQALDALVRERSTLIIAHRLSTILHADRIYVLQTGKIVASGTHTALLQQSPLYARLASFQFREQVPAGQDAVVARV